MLKRPPERDSAVDITFRLGMSEPMLMTALNALVDVDLITKNDMLDLLLNLAVNRYGEVVATNHNGIRAVVSFETFKVIVDIKDKRFDFRIALQATLIDKTVPRTGHM